MIKSYLEERDYSVLTALDGQSGLDIIKTQKPALVFMDIHMPGLDGLGVLSELKKEGISAKIILMTGVEEGPELDAAKALGIIDIIKKPVHLPLLSELIVKYA